MEAGDIFHSEKWLAPSPCPPHPTLALAATAIAPVSIHTTALAGVGPAAAVPAQTATNPVLSALPAGGACDWGRGAHRRREVSGIVKGLTCRRAHAWDRVAKWIREFGYTTMTPVSRAHASPSPYRYKLKYSWPDREADYGGGQGHRLGGDRGQRGDAGHGPGSSAACSICGTTPATVTLVFMLIHSAPGGTWGLPWAHRRGEGKHGMVTGPTGPPWNGCGGG